MPPLRRLVLDVLKPHEPTMLTLGRAVADIPAVEAATTDLVEIDEEVREVTLTVEGPELDYDEVVVVVEDLGGSVHSIDQAAYGEYVAVGPALDRE
jgi:hypothetical protein